MQRYLHPPASATPVPKQVSISRFIVTTPRYAMSPLPKAPTLSQSSPGKRPARRPVGRPPKKARIEWRFDHAMSEVYQRWVNLETKYQNTCFFTYCGGTWATMRSLQTAPRKHRGVYTAEKRLEVREYITTSGVSVRQASIDFNIPKSTIQDIILNSSMPAKRKAHKSSAGRPLSYSPEKKEQIVSWILKMRDVHLPVSLVEVMEKAREVVCTVNPNFKASNEWVQKIFKRNRFTLWAKTSLCQYLPKNLEERLTSFITSIKQHLRRTIPWHSLGTWLRYLFTLTLSQVRLVTELGRSLA